MVALGASPSNPTEKKDRLLSNPKVAAAYEAGILPVRFLVDNADFNVLKMVPAPLRRQIIAGNPVLRLTAADLDAGLFRIQITDPVLAYPEESFEFEDAQLARLNVSNPAAKRAVLTELVNEAYARAIREGKEVYRGVKIKVRLTAIMDLSTQEMIPQRSGANQVLAPGTDWIPGHRSSLMLVRPQHVGAWFDEQEFRNLHHYAVSAAIIAAHEGSDSAYSSENSRSRQWLTPANPSAKIEFQLVARNVPIGNQNPDGRPMLVPGIEFCSWSGMKVIGQFSGNSAEELGATVFEGAPVETGLSATDLDWLLTTPAEETLAEPVGDLF